MRHVQGCGVTVCAADGRQRARCTTADHGHGHGDAGTLVSGQQQGVLLLTGDAGAGGEGPPEGAAAHCRFTHLPGRLLQLNHSPSRLGGYSSIIPGGMHSTQECLQWLLLGP